MSYQEALSQCAVAISISESADMSVLGLDEEHLRDAMTEVARHLLALGAQLVYGGDLRAGGFTELLFELVARHRQAADRGDRRPAVSNYLAWPVHVSMQAEELKLLADDLYDIAEINYLTADGRAMSFDERKRFAPRQATEGEWADGLTAMRRVLTDVSDARIVLGGRVDRFKGRMPGIAEEALSALRAGQPLFLLGGFGGCARDIAQDLGIVVARPISGPSWPGRGDFVGFDEGRLNNGLDAGENAVLARTAHIDEAIALILHGLLRLEGGAANASSEMSP